MRRKVTRRITAAAAVLTLCVLLLLPVLPTASASGTERRTVRVGLPDVDVASTSASENRMVAFEKDYMQAVAEYANWDCVYIKAPWSECLNMVKRGELDALPYVSKTAERMKYFDYSSESMGTEMCYLFGPKDTSLQYDDFDAFDGMTIGYEAGSTLVSLLQGYGREAHFSFRLRSYQSGAAMFADLDSGRLDAAAQTNFYDTPSGHVILAKFSPTPIYIITSKADPSLKLELDSAMAQLFSYTPSFNTDLFKYHFGNASQKISYTQREQEYLATSPVVNVFYETSWEPFEYDRSGKAGGITPEIIRAIGRDTGIQFRFILLDSTQDVYKGIDKTTSDAVMAISHDYSWANSHDLLLTQPYVSGSVMRVSRRTGSVKSVAVVKDGYLAAQIQKSYPDLKKVAYLTFADCMDAVTNGEADCTFLNYYQASYYRSFSAYRDFSYQPEPNITQAISLGVTRQSDPALFGVLSKSLQRISSNTVQGILSENSTQAGALSLHLLLRRYPVQMALLFALVGTLTGLLIILLVTSGVRKRQNVRLAAAKQEADAANRAKSEFLSRMSHDMRTPLNGIIGMTYLTGQMALPRDARENLEKIDISSRFLLNLINDLLDMTKAESGKIELHPEPYPAEEFRQYLEAVIRPLCESKNQSFTADIDLPEGFVPQFDKLRMNQILFNLLSNAVKYTPEGGSIRYTAHFDLLPGQRARMHAEVADNGIGMSEAFQKVLFSPFTQEGRNDNSEFRGSGLGLAITKQLVDLMGGTISVASTVGKGSTLTVEIETSYQQSLPSAPPPAPQVPGDLDALLAGRHILLCEDHPLNQEIARALLTEKGMVVEIADDGQRSINAFSRSSVGYYDAVLMDIRMPVMDGYAATRAIRALNRPDAQTVPILAMSADVFTDDVQRCLDAGMNGHVAKPIDPQTMYREIAAAIQSRSSRF